MRGKRIIEPYNGRYGRITPADAGKTIMALVDITTLQDHPRGCGENRHIDFRTANNIGSPPRMRGKRRNAFSLPHLYRITPADAGKTCLVDFGQFVNQDHPRGCGENL